MPPNKETTVYVSESEAKNWMLFQEFFDPFEVMVTCGVFKVRNGSVSLDFDKEGTLRAIRRSDVLYNERYGDIRPLSNKG